MMLRVEFWELLSYVVTVVGLPLAISTFWKEQRKERENEEEETYQLEGEDADFAACIQRIADEERACVRAAVT
jgi:hypothetical protein